jgi:hypothetical protein
LRISSPLTMLTFPVSSPLQLEMECHSLSFASSLSPKELSAPKCFLKDITLQEFADNSLKLISKFRSTIKHHMLSSLMMNSSDWSLPLELFSFELFLFYFTQKN